MADYEATPETDALVAERVMSWEITHRGRRVQPGHGWQYGEVRGHRSYAEARRWIATACPRYSTDISAAWQVVEKLRSEGWTISLDDLADDGPWQCYLHRHWREVGAVAPTAQLAICRAALAITEPSDPTGEATDG